MGHYYNSSASFNREGNHIFQAKNDGYICNDLYPGPWILCQTSLNINFEKESRKEKWLLYTIPLVKPTFPLGHTCFVQSVFQSSAFLNTNDPSYQQGLGSYECLWLSATHLILYLSAQRSPPIGQTTGAAYGLLWASPALLYDCSHDAPLHSVSSTTHTSFSMHMNWEV